MGKKNQYQTSKNAVIEQITAQMGKVPPQAIELEEAVLGALMLEKDSILEVIDILKPDSFYNDHHKKIYQAIVHLCEKHVPIDILTVTEELRKTDELELVGGPFYITQLTNKIASAAHIEYHARIIVQKYLQRTLIETSSEIQRRAFDPGIDVDELIDFSEKAIFNVAYGNIKKESVDIQSIIKESLRLIEDAGKRDDGLSGIPCGFTKLDRVTAGWQRSDLVIIAARPAMGKTSFVLSMARNIAVAYKRPIALFSLEMSSVQIVNRLIVAESQLSSDKIKTGRLANYEWEQLLIKIKELSESKMFIDDTPGISLFELRAKCRRLKMQHQIELVVIDYLQLMTFGGGGGNLNREQEVSNISRGLKVLAKELNVPILALSQLNRSVETRTGDKRPQLSDLRESGAIEQDADIVMFIHRPEKFGITEDEEGNSTKGLAEIVIAKHRNGPTGIVGLRFIDHLAKFADEDEFALDPLPIDTSSSDSDEPEIITIGSKLNDDDSVFNVNPNFDTDTPF